MEFSENIVLGGKNIWPTKKFLGFKWFERVKITLETKVFDKFLQFLFFHVRMTQEILKGEITNDI